MNDQLDKLLCDKYPNIFANRYADMQTTAMCWGFECGDGWFNIIDKMCYLIQGHIDWKNKQHERLTKNNPQNIEIPDIVPQVIAEQVKEKFGTLRFYYEGGDDYIRGIVTMAEAMSGSTCENCGLPGTPTTKGWIRTLCEQHKS